MAESKKITIAYWGIRGAGQPLRNLASYLNVPFEDKFYTDPAAWFGGDKATLKSDFPNLPYLVDGEKVVTESEAIAVYLAFKGGKLDLLGSSADERIHLAQVRGVFHDVRKALYEIVFNKATPDVVKAYETNVLPKLTLLSKHLGANEFLAGKLSVVDFFLAETVGWIRHQDGDWLASVPNLKAYVDRVEWLAGVKEYLAGGSVPKVYMNPAYVHEKVKV